MKRTNLFKAMATILAVALIIAMVPMAAMAANTVTVDIDYDYNANKAVVKGSIASGAELTMVTVLADEELTSLDGFSDTELENAIMYIDQITSDGTEKTWTFELRDTAEGNVLTAFVGGTDATVLYESVKILAAAPAIAPAATEYFSDETITFTVTDAVTGWSDAAEVYVNGTKDESASVSDSEITFTADANVTKVEVKNADYQDAKWEGTVTVKDRYTEAKKAVKSATIVYEEDGETATITVPADETDAVTGADIAYTVTVDGVNETPDADGKISVARKDDNEDDVNDTVAVVITATITKDGSSLGDAVEQTINVNEMCTDGYTIVAEDITLSAANAFGDATAKVATVKIAKDSIDPTTQTVKVNGTAMFYTPERSTGDVYTFVAIVRENNADTAAVATVAEIADEPASAIYYGKVSNPAYDAKLGAADVARGLAMFKANAYDSSYTDQQYLVADVIGNGSVKAAQVARLLAAFKSAGSTDKSGFNILGN